MGNLRRVTAAVLGLAGLIAGCTPADSLQGLYTPPVAAGDRVEVLRPVPVAAGYARVYLQGGRPVGYMAMNQYLPQCSFLLDRPRETRQFVLPGDYRVTRVRQEDTEIVQRLPLQLAARAGWRGDGDGEILLATLVTMELAGPQPELRLLACSGAFQPPFDVRPPTLEEIDRALGDYARVVSARPGH